MKPRVNLVIPNNILFRKKVGIEKKKRIVSKTMYYVENDHEAIISAEDFVAVQNERARRSNIVIDSDGQSKRKSVKYSSKNNLYSE